MSSTFQCFISCEVNHFKVVIAFFTSPVFVIVVAVAVVHKTLLHLIMCFICHIALGVYFEGRFVLYTLNTIYIYLFIYIQVCVCVPFFLCWLVQNLVVTYFGFSVAQIFSISISHTSRKIFHNTHKQIHRVLIALKRQYNSCCVKYFTL